MQNTISKLFQCSLNYLIFMELYALNLAFVPKYLHFTKTGEFLINYILYTYTNLIYTYPIVFCCYIL